MKNLIITISFLAIAAAAFAGNNGERVITAEQKLDYAIQTRISSPNFLLEREGMHTAEVHFTVSADGSIHVTDVVSPEEDLKENIAYQMKNMKVSTAGLDLNDNFKIVLRFNII